MEISKANIGQALHSAADDHVTAVANDIYDETLGKYQSEINGEVGQGDGVYDISAANPSASPFASLQEALTAFTDTTKKKGGMTIKYIGTDGKYHQYRYMLATLDGFNNKSNWDNLDDISELKTKVQKIVGFDFHKGYYVDAWGNLDAASTYNYTDFIPINAGDKVLFSGSCGVSAVSVAGYNSDKSFIRALLGSGDFDNEIVEIPDGISYIRLCGRNETFSATTIALKASLLLNYHSYDNEFQIIISSNYLSDKSAAQLYRDGNNLVFKGLFLRDSKGIYKPLVGDNVTSSGLKMIEVTNGYTLFVKRSEWETESVIQLRCAQSVDGKDNIILGGVNALFPFSSPISDVARFFDLEKRFEELSLNNISIDVSQYLNQGNSSNKGIIVQDDYYNTRLSCIIDVTPFRVNKTKLSAIVDSDKIIRNFALYNKRQDISSGWFFENGNNSNIVNVETSANEQVYDRIIITVAQPGLTDDITIFDVNSLTVSGVLAIANVPSNKSDYTGKKYSVMGDSIGTDNDEDTPLYTITANDVGKQITSWVTWYDYNNSREDDLSGTTKTIGGVAITLAMVGTQQRFTPNANDIGKTLGTPRWAYNRRFSTKPWWKIVGENLGMTLDASASWNGNSYCSHEESDNLRKIGYGWHPLQISRLANRDIDGSRIAPDVIFLCRGTNDATHTPFAKITDFGSGINPIPQNDIVQTDYYGFKEALAKTISSIQMTYPNAEIFVCTLSPFRRLDDSTFPMDNGLHTMQEYNKAIKEIAEYMGCKVIDFSKCWTFYNCISSGYVNNSDYTHPLQKGHNAMAAQALRDIL